MFRAYLLIIIMSLSFLGSCESTPFRAYTPPSQQQTQQPLIGTVTQSYNPQNPPPVQQNTTNPDGPNYINTIENWFSNFHFPTLSFGHSLQVWHIGDGDEDDSSCKWAMLLRETKGTAVNYYFIVNQLTNINITVKRLCGVDYNDSDYAYVRDTQGNEYMRALLTPGQTEITFNGLVFDVGTYYVRVESDAVATHTMPDGHIDLDDFVVGDVTIDADQTVTLDGFTMDQSVNGPPSN